MNADFLFHELGALSLLKPRTHRAKEWARAHLRQEDRIGDAYIVENGDVGEALAKLDRYGLVVVQARS